MNTVESILRENIEKESTPSLQYMFFDSTHFIYQFQNGFASIKDKKKVGDKTTLHAYSVTKTFTALAILQLAEQRKLLIDEPVKSYLPEFPYSGEITIKQLLTHSAGIPNPMPLNWIHLISEHNSFNRDDFFKPIFNKHNKIKSNPNEKFAYSNLGYVILGQLIEKVSGISYENYIRENILARLGLQPHELGFVIPDLDENATGYHKRISFSSFILGMLIDKSKYMGAAEDKWQPFQDFYVNGSSYGGLIGTPHAFVKYIQELLKKDGNLLSRESKKMLFTEPASVIQVPSRWCCQ